MSGYLQRLVRTVAQPADSVHPRTGSIFSPHRNEPAPPLHGWEETETVALSQPQPTAAATSSDVDVPESPRTGQPKSVQVPLLPKTVLSESPGPTMQPAQLMHSAPLPGRGSEHAPDRTAPTTSVNPKVPPRPAADHAYRALMKPIGVTEARKDFAVSRDMRPQRHVEKVERQPDEIQIHIGRIEVTAVPPAPRASKMPDPGPSLDAYLKRREGRAG
jgi:hypothetical protein